MSIAKSPADQIADLLPNTIVTASPLWTLKIGQLTAEPNRVIVFTDTGGLAPDPKWKLDFVMVQVIVRADPDDYTAGWQKARQIRDYLLGITPQTLVSGDRIDGIICRGDVGLISYDDQKRPLFSVNFQIFWEPGDTNTTSREPL